MYSVILNTVRRSPKFLGIIVLSLMLGSSAQSQQTDTDKAKRLFTRLTGTTPEPAVLSQMATMISGGDKLGAAAVAMNNRNFYDVTVKNMAASWSNVEISPTTPLNDATALVIGLIANDKPFNQVLTGDIIYVGVDPLLPAYSKATEDAKAHFAAIEASGDPLSTSIEERVQSTTTGISQTAGILTTQAFGEAYFSAGTNRRMFGLAAVRHFWCREMEQIADTSMPETMIKKDVDRAPGGDPGQFKNKCIGCHSLQDAGTNAFNFFDYDETDGLLYTPGQVVEKTNGAAIAYPSGYEGVDDMWRYMGDFSATNSFAKFGWRGPATGNGISSFASALSQSAGFSKCMAEKVFTKVCRPITPGDAGRIKMYSEEFEKDGAYNMKNLFGRISTDCMDDSN